MMHDVDDDAERESLGNLLLAGGGSVEIEALDERHVVALIDPSDLDTLPETVQ